MFHESAYRIEIDHGLIYVMFTNLVICSTPNICVKYLNEFGSLIPDHLSPHPSLFNPGNG